MPRVLIFIFIIFFQHHFCFAQKKTAPIESKKTNKKLSNIKQLLNDFEITQALNAINKLQSTDEYSPEYNELEVNVLKQILDRIKYAKEETEETVSTGYMTANGFVHDTLDWANESDSAMLQFSSKTNQNNNEGDDDESIEVLDVDKNIKPQLKENKISPTAIPNKKTNPKDAATKKKKSWWANEDGFDINENESSTFVDSSIIKNGIPTDQNNSELSSDNINNDAIRADEDAINAGFQKTKSKTAKQIEKMQKIREGYTQLDYKFYKSLLINSARKSTLYVQFADSAGKFLREYLVDTIYSKHIWKEKALEHLESANELLLEKEFSDALVQLNEAMILEPLMPEIYLMMGDTYRQLQMDSMANEYYNASLLLDTISPNVHFHLSKVYFHKGDFQKALNHIIEAIVIYPDKQFFDMIQQINIKAAYDINLQWIPRLVFPITTLQNSEEIYAEDDKNPWYFYQAAKKLCKLCITKWYNEV